MKRQKTDQQPKQQVGIVYCRKSTNKQDVTVQDQAERGKAYFVSEGIEPRYVIADEASGGKPLAERIGGVEALRLLASGEATDIWVLKLDRAFRNAGDCLRVTEEWNKAGIGFHAQDVGVDTHKPSGRFFLTVIAGVAEMERAVISERTRNGLDYRKQHGQVYSNEPYGFTARDGKLIPNPAEQKVITRIKRLRTLGKSYESIAQTLNKDGIQAKRGGAWSRGAVHYVLNNGLHD